MGLQLLTRRSRGSTLRHPLFDCIKRLASIIYFRLRAIQAGCVFGETIIPQASQSAENIKNYG